MHTQSHRSTFKAHLRPYLQLAPTPAPCPSPPRYAGLSRAQLREIVMEQLG